MVNTAARLRGEVGREGRADGRRTQHSETHPGQSVRSEDANVAVERQDRGNSQTEAALFNVNIDFFFKGQQFLASLALMCVLSHARSLSFSYTYFL